MTTQVSPTRRFFGALLMLVGGLVAAFCGLCGSAFIVAGLWNAVTGSGGDGLSISAMGLVIGGVPAALGVGLFLAGRAMRRP